jgi:uncharacterized membrane protein
MYNERPRIQIQQTSIDRWLDAISYLLLTFLVAYPVYLYSSLPEPAAVHADISRRLSSYKSKEIILILPTLGVFLFIMFTILLRYPHLYNYPEKITAENALGAYTGGIRFMRIMRIWVLFIFILIVRGSMGIALNRQDDFLKWILPIVFLFTAMLIIYVFFKLMRIKK